MGKPDDDNLNADRTRPEYMWLVGYEHMVDSMRRDTTDTYAAQAQAAHVAGLMFASAQARALVQIADRLGELVEQQRTANFLAAVGDHRTPMETAAEFREVNETLRRLVGLDDKPEVTGE